MINLWGINFHLYGLLIGLGVYAAWEVILRYGRVKSENLERLFFGLIFSGVVGARLYHVIDYWSYYSGKPEEIVYLWNGGLGIWGALVGGILFLAVYSYFKKVNFWNLLDSIVLGVPLAQAIGRLGNWVNGELYGKNGEPLFAWEGGLNLILFSLLVYLSKKDNKKGFLSGVYFCGYGVIRIFLENFRPDSSIWRIGGFPTAIIFGLIAVVFGLTLIVSQKQS